ncbi:hypothetical protein FNF27_08291 [Cafeteria roenbergensis]|uniref:Uncharacterized protein n=1 Tax=Cafeteria roenbergensis TaxID=33653 RepID=A0A5A8D3M2_CAFRO|nr:hypothetical protein FNF29_04408 [Cafeteria roenbergensis]KAA0159765.1 hypothetical protein FNF27_08291 [Cafeteria roenbergensis]|eukprot:KAA0151723.1 hypothetical protein FNF29_04408 [Cafeteria roenbergensis]
MAAAPDFKIRALKLTEEAELPSLVPDEAKATLHPHYEEISDAIEATQRSVASISVLMRGVLIAQIALLVLVVVLPLVVALVGWIGTGFPFGAYAGNIVAIVLGIMAIVGLVYVTRIQRDELASRLKRASKELNKELRDCVYRVIVTSNASEVNFPQSSDPGEATFCFTTRPYGAADSSRPTPSGATSPGFKGATAPRDDGSSKHAAGADEAKPTDAGSKPSKAAPAKDTAAAAADRPDEQSAVRV